MPRWRRDSIFGDGPRAPLDRNGRARFRFLVEAHHRAGRLTRAARDVALALLQRHGQDGRLDPSHATVAEDAACCERTVRRACEALHGLGLLRWVRRLLRDGPYVEQTSNAYELMPAGATVPAMRIGDGQNGRETRLKFDSPLLSPRGGERKTALKGVATALQRLGTALRGGSGEPSPEQMDAEARENAARQLRALGVGL